MGSGMLTTARGATTHGLAEAVLRAQSALIAAATPDGLRAAAAAIEDAAATTGCTALVPASPSARGAVAAAVLLSEGRLTQADDGGVLQGAVWKVLVVEVAAVSGLRVRRCVASLRGAGAAWIGLVVLHDEAPDGPGTGEQTHRFGPVDHLLVR